MVEEQKQVKGEINSAKEAVIDKEGTFSWVRI